jgi:hypothetical protein
LLAHRALDVAQAVVEVGHHDLVAHPRAGADPHTLVGRTQRSPSA